MTTNKSVLVWILDMDNHRWHQTTSNTVGIKFTPRIRKGTLYIREIKSVPTQTGAGPLLTHWGRVTHICISKLASIVSDNCLSPGRHQAIIWTIAGILLIGPLGTNFSEIIIGFQTFSFKKMHLKMSSAKWRPSCLGLNVLMSFYISSVHAFMLEIKYKSYVLT